MEGGREGGREGGQGLPIVVVADVREGNLGRVQVLESDIHALESRAEGLRALLHHAGLVRIEGKALREGGREGGREGRMSENFRCRFMGNVACLFSSRSGKRKEKTSKQTGRHEREGGKEGRREG